MSHEDTSTPQVVEIKVLESVEIKDEEKGEIEAVFATLDVVDKDHDIIRPSAIAEGAKAKLSDYAHSAVFGASPVGKGTMHQVKNKAVFRGRYFMSTTRGVEAFKTLKEIGADQEWSFGYQVLGSEEPEEEDREKGAWRILTKLDAFEISPVLRGAGLGTRTLSVKAAGGQPPVDPPPPNPDPPAAEPPAVDPLPGETKATEAAEAQRLADEVAEAEAKRLQQEIDEGVERFQRTRRQFGL